MARNKKERHQQQGMKQMRSVKGIIKKSKKLERIKVARWLTAACCHGDATVKADRQLRRKGAVSLDRRPLCQFYCFLSFFFFRLQSERVRIIGQRPSPAPSVGAREWINLIVDPLITTGCASRTLLKRGTMLKRKKRFSNNLRVGRDGGKGAPLARLEKVYF